MRGLNSRGGRTGGAAPGGVHALAPQPARLAYHVDRWTAEEIAGWVANPAAPETPLAVRFSVAGVPVGLSVADMVRVDVEKAGRGPRNCGFHWPVPASIAEICDADQPVTIEALTDPPTPMGEVVLPAATHRERPTTRNALRNALDDALAMAATATLRAAGADAPTQERGRFALHEKLFLPVGAPPGEVSPYLTFTRRRLRQEQKFPLDGSAQAKNAYLRWYLDVYSQQRQPLRTPLGAAEIAWLNEPVGLVGVPYKLSRASLSYALTEPDGMKLMPIDTLPRYEAFVAWWCADKAPALSFEDCLVPDYYVEVLRRVPIPSMAEGWPLSVFMWWYFHKESRFHQLDLPKESQRLLYYVWFALAAAHRPGLLRFMPSKHLAALLDGPAGQTPFDRALQGLHEAGPALAAVFTAQQYRTLLRRRGYDLTRGRYLTRDRAGHRFDTAGRGPSVAPQSERVDVQLIGPLQKSSGLGQATRLSAATLKASGLDVNFVDFGLDNPAPVGMNNDPVGYGRPRDAKINLIHLNGETIPIAFAYMPDVFNGAYNIGYFFWELSSPAAPHRLALEVLDEVWVASEFGVSIYQSASDRPVTCVGMAFEPVAEPDVRDARAFLASRVPIGPDTFVCLATFDSFSFLERKNPHGLCEAFLEAFGADEDVLLVLKTHNRDFVADPHQQLRWDRIVELANADPRFVLLNETMKFDDLIKLKKGADAYLSLHRSEGWGFGLLEAMSIGTPVLSTGYSGNMDFTKPDTAYLVDYDLVEPQPNEYIFVERGQTWAAPRLASAVEQLRAMRADPGERARRAANARRFVHETYSLEAQARRYRARLTEILKERRG